LGEIEEGDRDEEERWRGGWMDGWVDEAR